VRPLLFYVRITGYKTAGGRMSAFSIRTKPFRLDWADYRALYLTQILRFLTVFPLAVVPLFFGFAFPLLESLGDLQAGLWHKWLLTQLSVLAFYAVAAFAGACALWLRLRRDPAMTGERLMVLDSGAVRLVGPGFDVREAWPLFRGVRQSRHHIFLCQPGTRAYVLPKRALSSPDDAVRLMVAVPGAILAARRAPAPLSDLPEAPDNRDLWRSHAFTMALDRPLSRVLQNLGTAALAVLGVSLVVAIARSWPVFVFDPRPLWGLFAIAAIVFVPLLAVAPIVWSVMRRRPDRRDARVVCFTRDYVRSTSATADRRADWGLVREVDHMSGTFVFRMAIGVVCIPASAFATKAEAMAFYAQAVAFWRAAQARRQDLEPIRA